MKKILCAVVLAVVMSSCANAAVPSVVVLSTKTYSGRENMEKALQEIDAKYSGKISTGILYLEDHPEVVKQYSVRHVPMLVFRDATGEIAATEAGCRSVDEILAVFRKAGVNVE